MKKKLHVMRLLLILSLVYNITLGIGSNKCTSVVSNASFEISNDQPTELNIQWERTYGGLGRGIIYSVIQTTDGGFAFAGETKSSALGGDLWLMKIDTNGEIEWEQTYGTTSLTESAQAVIQTRDGGFALVSDVRNGWCDNCLLKTDAR